MSLRITAARFPGGRAWRKLPVPVEVPTDGTPLIVPADAFATVEEAAEWLDAREERNLRIQQERYG